VYEDFRQARIVSVNIISPSKERFGKSSESLLVPKQRLTTQILS
jgi:hypothetical protein